MPFIPLASSIPMLISVKVSSQFQTFTVMSNFKFSQSCQFQTSTVLSIPDSYSHVSQFQFAFAIQFTSVIGQVASSHPRTACACQFTSVIGQVASSHPRTACACQSILVTGQVASSHPRTACTYQFVSFLV